MERFQKYKISSTSTINSVLQRYTVQRVINWWKFAYDKANMQIFIYTGLYSLSKFTWDILKYFYRRKRQMTISGLFILLLNLSCIAITHFTFTLLKYAKDLIALPFIYRDTGLNSVYLQGTSFAFHHKGICALTFWISEFLKLLYAHRWSDIVAYAQESALL